MYQRALLKEPELQGLQAQSQVPLSVSYKNYPVGRCVVDVIGENRVISELKAQNQLSSLHQAQLMNDLRASGISIGMLINFTMLRAAIKRIVI